MIRSHDADTHCEGAALRAVAHLPEISRLKDNEIEQSYEGGSNDDYHQS